MKQAFKALIVLPVCLVLTSCVRNSGPTVHNYIYLEEQPVQMITSKLVFSPELPAYIPIHATSKTASLESYDQGKEKFQEATMHYRNETKKQLLNLIITNDDGRIYTEEKLAFGKNKIDLNSLIHAYYEEDEDAQSLWWIKDHLTYRFVYFINDGQPRLDRQELIDAANSTKK